MNERFRRIIIKAGWVERGNTESTYTNIYNTINYVKVFQINLNGVNLDIPVDMLLTRLDKNELPRYAMYSFVNKPDMHISYNNRTTCLKGADRIVMLFDMTGYMHAIKFEIYAHAAKFFKQPAKLLLSQNTGI